MEKVLRKAWEQAASKGSGVGCPGEGTKRSRWVLKQRDEANQPLWGGNLPLAVSQQQARLCLEPGPKQSISTAPEQPQALPLRQVHAEQRLPGFPECGSALLWSCFRSNKAGQGTAWACVNPVPANPRSGRARNCGSETQEPPGLGPAEGWRMSSCLSPEVINPSEQEHGGLGLI